MHNAFHKYVAGIGHAFMLTLIFLSVSFYEERMLHTDNAYSTFVLINTQEFQLPHYRYPLVFTQILPLLAVKLNLSVSVVIVAYSVGFYLMYYCCFLACVFLYKNAKAAIMIVFGLLAATSELFFLQTEILHGLVFCCLFYAWLTYSANFKNNATAILHYTIGVLVFVISITFHPVSAVFMVILLYWNAIDTNNLRNINTHLLALLAIASVILKAKLTQADSYEGSFYQSQSLFSSISNFWHSYVMQFFIARIKGLYLLSCLMYSAGLVWLLFFKKQYLLSAFLVLSGLGYLFLSSIIFKGDSDIMMERVFLVFGLITSLAFIKMVFDVIDSDKIIGYKYLALVATIICLSAGVVKIFEASKKYSYRLDIVAKHARILQEQNGAKSYTTNASFPYPFSFWASACEHFLYSSIHYPQQIKTLYVFNDDTDAMNVLSKDMSGNNILLAPFYLKIDDSFLNKKYFPIDSGIYSRINFN